MSVVVMATRGEFPTKEAFEKAEYLWKEAEWRLVNGF